MTNHLFHTKNDIPQPRRSKLVDLLAANLASSIDLYLQTKQAHWNVKGANFIALHKLFDEAGEIIEDAVDDLAERIVQLGGTTRGTLPSVAKETSLPAYPLDITSGADHVEALSSALAAFAAQVRAASTLSDELDDGTTADLFTQISRAVDKQLWLVEAHALSR